LAQKVTKIEGNFGPNLLHGEGGKFINKTAIKVDFDTDTTKLTKTKKWIFQKLFTLSKK
jgi:hypothetical protein